MSDRKTKLQALIAADHAAAMGILKGIPADDWVRPVPSDEGAEWKARDVLAHLAVSETGQLGQLSRLAAGGITVPDDFDLNRFNRRSVQKSSDKPITTLMAEIEDGHRHVLQTLDAMDESELDKTGRHARGDFLSVEGFFRRITEHRREHAEQLRDALAA